MIWLDFMKNKMIWWFWALIAFPDSSRCQIGKWSDKEIIECITFFFIFSKNSWKLSWGFKWRNFFTFSPGKWFAEDTCISQSDSVFIAPRNSAGRYWDNLCHPSDQFYWRTLAIFQLLQSRSVSIWCLLPLDDHWPSLFTKHFCTEQLTQLYLDSLFWFFIVVVET